MQEKRGPAALGASVRSGAGRLANGRGYPRPLLLLLLWLIASPVAWPRSAGEIVIATIAGGKASVVAFMPPSMRGSTDKEAAAAREHVRSAIAEVKDCLGDELSYSVVFADRIAVDSIGREETFDVGDFAPLVGALLLRPDTGPRILFAGGGPQALARLLRAAASEYFGKRCKAG
jgi:hypothetical protein